MSPPFENTPTITHLFSREGIPDRTEIDVFNILDTDISYLLDIDEKYIGKYSVFIRIKFQSQYSVFVPYKDASEWICENHIDTTYGLDQSCEWCNDHIESGTKVVLFDITSNQPKKVHLGCFTKIQSHIRQIQQKEHLILANLI